MLQNLLYFMYKKLKKLVELYFLPHVKVIVSVNIDQNIHKGKSKVAQNEKRKKRLLSYL